MTRGGPCLGFFCWWNMVALSATTTRPPEPQGKQDASFIVYERVPIFDAHTGDDGVVYNQQLLQAIANNCNRRIETTGDWTPLVIGHTSAPDEPKLNPPVVGFAGPFWVDRFTNHEGQPSYAIYCKCWIFPACNDEFRRNPRRSVEVWPEESPEKRYFDPIACLGAETPRRDLGLIYSKPRLVTVASRDVLIPSGVERFGDRYRYSRAASARIRYEASAPGAGNVFLPSTSGRKPLKYQEPGIMADTADLSALVPQLIEAFTPLVQQMVDAAVGNGASNVGDLGAPPPAPGGGLDPSLDPNALGAGAPPAGGMPPMPPPDPTGGGLPGAPPITAPPGAAIPQNDPDAAINGAAGGPVSPPTPGGAPPDPTGGAPKPDADKKQDNALFRKFMKYAKAGDEAGAKGFMGMLDNEEKGELQKYMADAEEEGKQMYAKCGGEMTGDADEATPEKYAKAVRSRDDWRQKYAKLSGEHTTALVERNDFKLRYEKAQAEATTAKADAWNWQRRQRLETLYNDGVVVEVEDELANTASFTAEQFAKHETNIKERYQRAPRHHIQVTTDKPAIGVTDGTKRAAMADRAEQVVQQYRKAHPKEAAPKFDKVLRALEGNPAATDEQLVAAGK